MFLDDESLDARAPRLTHVIYNAALGHVRVRSEDILPTTVEVPPGEVRFRRVLGAQEPEAALWLDSTECDALVRLLEYAADALRIAPEYQPTLATVQAKLSELAPLTTVASRPDGEDGRPRGPIVEPPEQPAEPLFEAAPLRAEEATPLLLPLPDESPAPRSPASATEPPRRSGNRRTQGRSAAAAGPSSVTPPDDQPPPSARDTRRAEHAPTEAEPSPPIESIAAASTAHTNGESAGASGAGKDDAPAVRPPRSFREVWRDLQVLGSTHSTLHALAGQVTSEVREVGDDGIWVYSHGIGREYCVQRDQLESAWKALTAAGKLVARDLGLSQGAVTLLAHLSYVDYSAQPVTLHYPAETPHPLGTVVRRDLPP